MSFFASVPVGGGAKVRESKKRGKRTEVLEVMINLEQNCVLVAVCASVANWLAAL